MVGRAAGVVSAGLSCVSGPADLLLIWPLPAGCRELRDEMGIWSEPAARRLPLYRNYLVNVQELVLSPEVLDQNQ